MDRKALMKLNHWARVARAKEAPAITVPKEFYSTHICPVLLSSPCPCNHYRHEGIPVIWQKDSGFGLWNGVHR